jgi:hypothetical protein
MTRPVRLAALLSALAACVPAAHGAPALDLAAGFAKPPMAARPWVFWWFEGGYGGKEGMARDIAAMREKGIGGVMHMQTLNSSGMPLPAEPPMLGPAWADWFGEAARLAGKAGMTMSASIVDGWAFGGAWVDKEAAAKMLVSSELQVDGPGDLQAPLPMPFTRLGVYRDVAVVAFPESPTRPPAPAFVAGSHTDKGYCEEENWPAAHAFDADPETYWRTSAAPSFAGPVWIQATYGRPIAATAAYLRAMPDGGPRECELQASDDGHAFRTVARFTMGMGDARTWSIPKTSATTFRLLITSAHATDVRLAEFQMLRRGDQPVVRRGVKWWDLKSGNRGWLVVGSLAEEYPVDAASDLKSGHVIDLTRRLQPDGRLDWSPPAGRWTVMRFGWTTIGQPARMSGGGGYEVDVLSAKGADLMFDNAAVGMLAAAEARAPGVMKVFHTDSWEIGADVQGQQPTWTGDFREQFRRRRGYDLLPMLPAMARRLVDDRETTSRFLNDYRDTIADLVADYYGRLQQRAHRRKTLMNPESGYGSYPSPQIDGLKVFGRADLPMAEVAHSNAEVVSMASPVCDALRTAASGARIYGRQIVQAETLTYHPWLGQVTAPTVYRRTLNYCFANGLNQAVIHKYVHQPFEYKPGLEDYGIFSRHYTWWPMADGILGAIGRCQYMLQQGRFVADAAYFVGEGATRFVPSRSMLQPPLPAGCDFDGINAEVLLTRLSVKGGRLVLPDGLSYRYLVLLEPNCATMSPAVLARIRQLVAEGATVIGNPPRHAQGLGNRTAADIRIGVLVGEMWGARRPAAGVRRLGKGRVIWGRSLQAVMASDGVPPDLETAPDPRAAAAMPGHAGLQGAQWIWHAADGGNPLPGVRSFRATLAVPAGSRVVRALATMSADNEFVLSVNGKECLRSVDFTHAVDADITRLLRTGANRILVRATNSTNQPSPAGLIGRIVVTLTGGKRIELATDGDAWQSSADQAAWAAPRTLGPLGVGPWGMVDATAVAGMDWIHRRTDRADIYFIANPTSRDVALQAALRARDAAPELFDPLTGETQPLPEYVRRGARTHLPLRLGAYQGFFVVFRNKVTRPATTAANFPARRAVTEVRGPWSVRFDPAWVSPALGSGAKGEVEFVDLTDWTKRPEEGLRHYSGIATYHTTFAMPSKPAPGKRRRCYLSLGVVRDVARVRLNGRDLGTAWCEPWQVELTSAIRPGANRLEIDVANLWANRVIGDASRPASERLTKGNFLLPANTPLYPSGLMGPVRILASE